MLCARQQKSRSIALARVVFLFRDCPAMVGGSTVAGSTISGADTMAELGYLHRSPAPLGQGCDESGDNAGLSHAPGVPANYDNRHKSRINPSLRPAQGGFVLFTYLCSTVPGRQVASDTHEPGEPA